MRVNGNTARLGEQADGEEDVIELDGVRVRTRQEPEKIYRMLCKPRGFVTTTKRAAAPSLSWSRTCRSASIPSVGSTAIPRDCCS